MENDDGSIGLDSIADPGIGFLIANALKWAAYNKRVHREAVDVVQKHEAAGKSLDWLMQAVSLAAGNDLLRDAYGPPSARDRHLALLQLWVRLGPLQTLFGNQEDQTSIGSVSALRHELLALANGDEPALLSRLEGAGVSGRPVASFKIAEAKLTILQWDRFIKCRKPFGTTLSEFRSWVRHGFDTSLRNDWRKTAEAYLGPENVAFALSQSLLLETALPPKYDKNDIRQAVERAAARLYEAESHQKPG